MARPVEVDVSVDVSMDSVSDRKPMPHAFRSSSSPYGRPANGLAYQFPDNKHITDVKSLEAFCKLWPLDVLFAGLVGQYLLPTVPLQGGSCKSEFWSFMETRQYPIFKSYSPPPVS